MNMQATFNPNGAGPLNPVIKVSSKKASHSLGVSQMRPRNKSSKAPFANAAMATPQVQIKPDGKLISSQISNDMPSEGKGPAGYGAGYISETMSATAQSAVMMDSVLLSNQVKVSDMVKATQYSLVRKKANRQTPKVRDLQEQLQQSQAINQRIVNQHTFPSPPIMTAQTTPSKFHQTSKDFGTSLVANPHLTPVVGATPNIKRSRNTKASYRTAVGAFGKTAQKIDNLCNQIITRQRKRRQEDLPNSKTQILESLPHFHNRWTTLDSSVSRDGSSIGMSSTEMPDSQIMTTEQTASTVQPVDIWRQGQNWLNLREEKSQSPARMIGDGNLKLRIKRPTETTVTRLDTNAIERPFVPGSSDYATRFPGGDFLQASNAPNLFSNKRYSIKQSALPSPKSLVVNSRASSKIEQKIASMVKKPLPLVQTQVRPPSTEKEPRRAQATFNGKKIYVVKKGPPKMVSASREIRDSMEHVRSSKSSQAIKKRIIESAQKRERLTSPKKEEPITLFVSTQNQQARKETEPDLPSETLKEFLIAHPVSKSEEIKKEIQQTAANRLKQKLSELQPVPPGRQNRLESKITEESAATVIQTVSNKHSSALKREGRNTSDNSSHSAASSLPFHRLERSSNQDNQILASPLLEQEGKKDRMTEPPSYNARLFGNPNATTFMPRNPHVPTPQFDQETPNFTNIEVRQMNVKKRKDIQISTLIEDEDSSSASGRNYIPSAQLTSFDRNNSPGQKQHKGELTFKLNLSSQKNMNRFNSTIGQDFFSPSMMKSKNSALLKPEGFSPINDKAFTSLLNLKGSQASIADHPKRPIRRDQSDVSHASAMSTAKQQLISKMSGSKSVPRGGNRLNNRTAQFSKDFRLYPVESLVTPDGRGNRQMSFPQKQYTSPVRRETDKSTVRFVSAIGDDHTTYDFGGGSPSPVRIQDIKPKTAMFNVKKIVDLLDTVLAEREQKRAEEKQELDADDMDDVSDSSSETPSPQIRVPPQPGLFGNIEGIDEVSSSDSSPTLPRKRMPLDDIADSVSSKDAEEIVLSPKEKKKQIQVMIAQEKEKVKQKLKKRQKLMKKQEEEKAQAAKEAQLKRERDIQYKREKIQFKKKINQKMKQIEELELSAVNKKEDLVNEDYLESFRPSARRNSDSEDSGEKTLNRYQRTKISENDFELRKTFHGVNQETTTYLTDLLQDTYARHEKNRTIRALKEELKNLMEKKIEFVTMKKLERSVLAKLPMKKKNSVKSPSPQTKIIMNALKTQLIGQVRETVIAQQVARMKRKSSMSLGDIMGKAFLNMTDKQRSFGSKDFVGKKIRKKKKSRFAAIVRKHFMKKNQLNLLFLTKVVGMQVRLEEMLDEGSNMGKKYALIKKNLWVNDHQRKIQADLKGYNIQYLPFHEPSQLHLGNVNNLYTDTLQKLTFYKKAKQIANKEVDEMKDHFEDEIFIHKCEELKEVPVPTFTKLDNHCLFLSEIKINAAMSKTLKIFLESCAGNQEKIVHKLYIDDSGMRDAHLAEVLKGIQTQGKHLNTFVYASDEFGIESAKVLGDMASSLRELQFMNMSRRTNKQAFEHLFSSLFDFNIQLMNLKLSNVNLNDNKLVDLLCQIINKLQYLSHIDLSWGRLQPKQLVKVTSALKESLRLRWINLSYNTLYFDQNNNELQASEDAVENIYEIVTKSPVLVHLDFSGMNLGKDQMLYLADGLIQCEYLCSIHLSDNGVIHDQALLVEILEKFGLSPEEVFNTKVINYQTNKLVKDTPYLKKIVKRFTGALSSDQALADTAPIDSSYYKKHMLQTKQGKAVQINKLKNSITLHQGIGRTENNFDDKLILTRKANSAELIFNQNRLRDSYFEMQAQESWAFSDKQECYLCNKHKLTLIFFDQRKQTIKDEPRNQGLIEVTDPHVIDEVKEKINLKYSEMDEIAPILLGTVVGDNIDGFGRKVRMLRGDLFTMLSVCSSKEFITSFGQCFAVQRGIYQMVLDNQKIKVQESLDFLKGWETILKDKCLNNETTDLAVINLPRDLGVYRKDIRTNQIIYPECEIFVYAAYLPPGRHSFLLYCPVTKKLFCKDVMVDLSNSDHFPEYPLKLKVVNKQQGIIRKDVWAKFRKDTEEDMQTAYQNDIKESFNPELFIKDSEDCERAKEILLENFRILQVAYIEGLNGSPQTYPEIGFDYFIKSIMDQQINPKDKKRLPRSQIELAYISATRGDDAKGVGGTLCRGEFLEIILRLCKQAYPKQSVSDHLEEFIEVYFKPIFEKSDLLKIRTKIRISKLLNMLLFDNQKGLTMLYHQYCDSKSKRFTVDSARKFLATISSHPAHPSELTFLKVREVFIFSKMTNLYDLIECKKYFSLQYVEFLELLCRYSIKFWDEKAEKNPDKAFETVEEKVYASLEKIWAWREAHPPPVLGVMSKAQLKLCEFPALMPIPGEDGED